MPGNFDIETQCSICFITSNKLLIAVDSNCLHKFCVRCKESKFLRNNEYRCEHCFEIIRLTSEKSREELEVEKDAKIRKEIKKM